MNGVFNCPYWISISCIFWSSYWKSCFSGIEFQISISMTGVIINEGCLYNESCSTRAMLSSDFTLTLALITLTFESLFYSFIPYSCSQWLNVSHFIVWRNIWKISIWGKSYWTQKLLRFMPGLRLILPQDREIQSESIANHVIFYFTQSEYREPW